MCKCQTQHILKNIREEFQKLIDEDEDYAAYFEICVELGEKTKWMNNGY